MFHHIAGLFGRLFSSKGFQRGLRIFFGISVIYFLYNVGLFLAAVMKTGASFGEALRVYFEISFFDIARIPASASVALGIAVGLVWYFNRRRNRKEAEPDEKTEEPSDAVREEEIVEITHYKHF